MLIASGLMWIACAAVQRVPMYPHGSHKLDWAVQLFVLMIIGGGVYFGVCAAMGMKVLEHVRVGRGKITGETPVVR